MWRVRHCDLRPKNGAMPFGYCTLRGLDQPFPAAPTARTGACIDHRTPRQRLALSNAHEPGVESRYHRFPGGSVQQGSSHATCWVTPNSPVCFAGRAQLVRSHTMKFSAFIFAFGGCSYLAWDIVLMFSVGPYVSSVPMALLAIALLVQAYSLYRLRPRARLFGLISSAALAACFSGIVVIVVAGAWPFAISELSVDALSVIALVASAAVAFGLAFISLLRVKHAP